MAESWKDIAGFEGRYQVSDAGRVKSLPFRQRYLLRNGAEAYRTTSERIIAMQSINSRYLIVHLHLDGRRSARLVHRLVAEAFLSGPASATVNHKNSDRQDNNAENLEWATHSENLLHALANGRNRTAISVTDPATGRRFASITQAAKEMKRSPKTIRAHYVRCAER